MTRKTILSLILLFLVGVRLAGQPFSNLSLKADVADRYDRILIHPEKSERSFPAKAGRATLEVFGLEAFTSTVLLLLPRSITQWQDEYWRYFGQTFRKSWTEPPVWDHDPWPVNYIGHPLQGAYFFNSLRSQDCSFWASAGFAVFHTLLWEYGFEAIMEQPSIQDLIVNPLIGIPLGEGFHLLTKKMKRGGFTTLEKVLVTVINPTYVINNGYR